MRLKIQELIDAGYNQRHIAKIAKIDYMVLHRYYKKSGRDLYPEEEARVDRAYWALMGLLA